MWAWPNIELCNGRSLNVIPGKTATVARIFRPFMPSSIKTQDIKVVFVRFLHVCVSLFLHFVKTGTNSPTGTPPGQQAKFRDCPGQTGTVGNYDTDSGLKLLSFYILAYLCMTMISHMTMYTRRCTKRLLQKSLHVAHTQCTVSVIMYNPCYNTNLV